MIEPEHERISIVRQCELLGVSRAGYYYEPADEKKETQQLMRLIDEQYTRCPFYGYRKITLGLRAAGYLVNKKRVQRLMQLMGLAAIVPKPDLSKPHPEHRVYPYLLRNVPITKVNQVWSAEIVCTQMTKTDLFTLWCGRDDITDFDITIVNNNTIN